MTKAQTCCNKSRGILHIKSTHQNNEYMRNSAKKDTLNTHGTSVSFISKQKPSQMLTIALVYISNL